MIAFAKQRRAERDPRLWDADRFLQFYMARPEGERWQLVDGLAIMMVPPSKVHQRIADNFLTLLNSALQIARPELLAYREPGIRLPGVDNFHPEPDVAVLLAEATYSYFDERFFAVAEVNSPSNTAEMIERKIALYQSHPDNLYCLTIDQDSVHVRLWSRQDDWTCMDFTSLNDTLALSAFGFRARLADIYKGTPLARRNAL